MIPHSISPCECQPDQTSRLPLLVSPPYLFALVVLLLNDFALKSAWPGLITGKLSDFAGVFALGVFLLVCTRRGASLVALAVCFAIWKSPLSEPVIRAWNSAVGWTVGRTVDPTDLVALAVLPLAWRFYRTADAHAATRRGTWVLSSLVSLFAFTATSRGPDAQTQAAYHAAVAEFEFTADQPSFHVSLGRAELYRTLETRGFFVNDSVAVYPDPGQHEAFVRPQGDYALQTSSGRPELWSASFVPEQAGSGATLRLTKVSVRRNGHAVSKQEAIRLFESNVVAALR